MFSGFVGQGPLMVANYEWVDNPETVGYELSPDQWLDIVLYL
jgi:hypothetical protein